MSTHLTLMGDLPLVVLATLRETFFQTPLELKYYTSTALSCRTTASLKTCPVKSSLYLRGFAILLLLLLPWPGKEEATRSTFFEAVDKSAGLHIQQCLHGAAEESPEQRPRRVAQLDGQVQAH